MRESGPGPINAAQSAVVQDLMDDLATEYSESADGDAAVVAPVRPCTLGLGDSFMDEMRELVGTIDIAAPDLADIARSHYMTVLDRAELSRDAQ